MGLFKKKKKEEIKSETINNENIQNALNSTTLVNDNKPEAVTINQSVNQNINANDVQNNASMTQVVSNETPSVNSLESKTTVENQTYEVNIESNENSKQEIEVLDLEDKKVKLKTTIEKKRDFKFLLFLFGTVIIFVVCMPILRNIISPSSKIQINSKEEYIEESGNLEHGYIVINKESFKRVENIKFHDFKKYENNKIVFSYTADKTIRNISKLNIYIEVIDNEGKILNKSLFNVSEKTKKDSTHSFSIDLSSSSYDTAYYIKLEVIKPTNYTKTLVCTKKDKDENINTENEITYTFIDNMLKSYEYNQSFELVNESLDKSEYSNKYKELYNTFKQTNIKDEDILYTDNNIYYKIDFEYFNLGEIEFKTRYAENDYYDMISKKEKSKGWVCE